MSAPAMFQISVRGMLIEDIRIQSTAVWKNTSKPDDEIWRPSPARSNPPGGAEIHSSPKPPSPLLILHIDRHRHP